MKRYEPIIPHSDKPPGPATDFIACKNSYTLFVANSKFVVPVFFSDKNRHQETDIL